MKKVINKGYTVEVVSWENDGDNYRTKTKTYKTKEEAIAVKHMCDNLFKSATNNGGGIGNLMDYETTEAYTVILNYFADNPTLLEINNISTINSLKTKIQEEFPEAGEDWFDYRYDYLEEDEDTAGHYIDGTMHYGRDLMGCSEHYYSRISESATIYYSAEDVFLEEVS